MGMLRPRKALFGSGLLLLALAASGRGADLQSELQTIITRRGLGQTAVGVCVVDVATGRELVRINAEEPMAPASNLKLVTTAAALKTLGPDFVFRTELRLLAPLAAATTEPAANPSGLPTLVIQGDGDPALGDPQLLREFGTDAEELLGHWVQAVRGAGVTGIGQLLVDDRIFDDVHVNPHWPADQLDRWYCAPVCGVNFFENALAVFVQPTRPGEAPRVQVVPQCWNINVVNRATTGKEDSFSVARRPGTMEILVRGQVKNPRAEAVRVTVEDPAIFLGQLLAQRLRQAGVAVGEVGRVPREQVLPEGRTLHAIQTTLPVVLRRCNKDSRNLYAEALLKRMGHAYTGSPGSWENGAAAVRGFLSQTLGTQAAVVQLCDGSGLAHDNRVSARVLVNLLVEMARDPVLGPIYLESLAVAGQDGTLEKRNGLLKMRSRVLGKSGYINAVTTLSGYIVAPAAEGGDPAADRAPSADRLVAFSLLFNNVRPPIYHYMVKELQEQLLQAVDRRLAPPPAPTADAVRP